MDEYELIESLPLGSDYFCDEISDRDIEALQEAELLNEYNEAGYVQTKTDIPVYSSDVSYNIV